MTESVGIETDGWKDYKISRRLGRFVLGREKKSALLEQRRLQQIGCFGQVYEKALKAISYTLRLNRTPRAILGGSWVTVGGGPTKKGSFADSTLPVMINEFEESQQAVIQDGLSKVAATSGENIPADWITSFGFFYRSDDAMPRKISSEKKLQKVYDATFGINLSGTPIILSPDAIDSLPEQEQKILLLAAKTTEDVAFYEYVSNKPERVD